MLAEEKGLARYTHMDGQLQQNDQCDLISHYLLIC